MRNRRSFIQQMSALAGTAALGNIMSVQEAFANEVPVSRLSDLSGPAWARLRDRYLLNEDITYFNHASMGTIPRIVHEARARYLDICESNPWLYMWGGAWEQPREDVREKAANYLGCSTGEVVFTHNTTEGFNILAQGLPLGTGDEVVFSSLNHPGASICWFHQAAVKGFEVAQFDFPILELSNFTKDDVLDAYDRHISSKTRVLVFPHIDNIVGLRYPVKELSTLARSKGVEFVAVDGAQAVGMIPVSMAELGVDFYATSPHKWLQAPKGLGLLYVSNEVRDNLRSMWVTWGQERWKGTVRIFEDYGTRNLAEVLALGDAIDFQTELGSEAKETRLRELWEKVRAKVRDAPQVIWRSPTSWSVSSSVYAIEVRGVESGQLFGSMYQNHGFVFRAFKTQGLNTARISLNVYNTEDEIERFFEVVLSGAGSR